MPSRRMLAELGNRAIVAVAKRIGQIVRLSIAPIAALTGALAVGSILIVASGHDPISAYGSLFLGAFGSVSRIATTLQLATPMVFTALAFMIGYRAGAFNAGGEGQLYIAAITVAWVGVAFAALPAVILIPVSLLAAALAAGAWAAVPGWLRVRFGANELITSLMLSFVAIQLTDYIVRQHFSAREVAAETVSTPVIGDNAQLAQLIPPYLASFALPLAVLVAVGLAVLFRSTVFGYEARVSAASQSVAEYGGIRTGRIFIIAMFLSGAVAGLAGAGEVMGVHHRFITRFSLTTGFDGIAVAFIGRNHPGGILLAALFLAALKSGAIALERTTDISRAIVVVLTALALLFLTIGYQREIGWQWLGRRGRLPPAPPDVDGQ